MLSVSCAALRRWFSGLRFPLPSAAVPDFQITIHNHPLNSWITKRMQFSPLARTLWGRCRGLLRKSHPRPRQTHTPLQALLPELPPLPKQVASADPLRPCPHQPQTVTQMSTPWLAWRVWRSLHLCLRLRLSPTWPLTVNPLHPVPFKPTLPITLL